MTLNIPKWTSEEALDKGKQCIELLTKYRADIENRFKPGEIELLLSSIAVLESAGKAGQSEALVNQKAQTLNKGEIGSILLEEVMAVRSLVKAGNAPSDILMAFGVGVSVRVNSQPQLIAAANLIISGYNQHTEWAQKEAGILEDDIEEIQELHDQLSGSDATLGKKKFARRAKTVDKNTLQRTIEDLITKTSAIGIKVFLKKNKAIVPLFEALIPGSGSSATETNENDVTPEPATAGV